MRLRIQIACPAAPGSRQGNRITALRWARVLRSLGHRVRLTGESARRDTDVLIAMHARRSAWAARAFRTTYPTRPLIVALTGTDLYRDLGRSRLAAQSLALADALVLLQPAGLAHLPTGVRAKARIIYQSAERPARRPQRRRSHFAVCVLSHLRPVKDPLRAAYAARHLPPESRVLIQHAGRALSRSMAARARTETQRNRRYRWIGELSHPRALLLLARSHLLVLSSHLEGGANVIGEAAVRGIPVLASRVDGNVGMLGSNYPGLFTLGDTRALAALLRRAETDAKFYARLTHAVRRLAPRFHPSRERRAWRELLRRLIGD